MKVLRVLIILGIVIVACSDGGFGYMCGGYRGYWGRRNGRPTLSVYTGSDERNSRRNQYGMPGCYGPYPCCCGYMFQDYMRQQSNGR